MKALTLLTLLFTSFIIYTECALVNVNKCCQDGQFLTDELVCESHSKNWLPTIVTKSFSRELNSSEVKALLKNWHIHYTRPTCEPDEVGEFIRFEQKLFLLLDNGSLWLEGNFLTFQSFCFDKNAAIICVKNDAKDIVPYDGPPAEQVRRIYIKKCCRNKELYSKEHLHCNLQPNFESVSVSKFLEHTGSSSILNISNTYFEYGFPECKEGYIFTGKLSEHNSSLQQDGSLYLPTAKVLLEPKTFCLEFIEEEKGHLPTIITCPNYLPVRVNGSRISPEQGDIRFTLYPLALFVSVFFLAATLATGYLVPTTHHMLHWRCQTCHVACLMLGDFLLAVTQIVGHAFPLEICTIFGELFL